MESSLKPETKAISLRDDLVFNAELAEQCERFTEMTDLVDQIVKESKGNLTRKERQLLCIAYKNRLGMERAAIRILQTLNDNEAEKQRLSHHYSQQLHAGVISMYRNKIEAEQYKICRQMINLLENCIMPACTKELNGNPEVQVFNYKLLGDYYRYAIDVSPSADTDDVKQRALIAYNDSALAAMSLAPIHPTRLGLALNFSVFLYENLIAPEEALQMAQKAFDAAIVELENATDDDPSHDSTMIMQLLKDNIILWSHTYRIDPPVSIQNRATTKTSV